MGNSIGKEIEGKHVFLSEKYCNAEQLKKPALRVYLATGGFGCSPATRGKAVFVTQIAYGMDSRIEGYMLERFATDEEVESAKQLLKDSPPKDKTFTAEDVKFNKDGEPFIAISEEFVFPVAPQYEAGGKKIHHVRFMSMPHEGWMNEFVGFAIRDVRYAVENEKDVDFAKIKEHMTNYAKGWLGSILGLIQSPIAVTINLDTLTPERREQFTKYMSDTERELLFGSPTPEE